MYLKLISIFPYKYSIPAESDIRKVIGALVAKKKELLKEEEDTESDEEDDESMKGKRKVSSSNLNVPEKYITFINEVIQERSKSGKLDTLKPKDALELAKKRFNKRLPGLSRAGDFKAFKCKFSNKKSLEKKKKDAGDKQLLMYRYISIFKIIV